MSKFKEALERGKEDRRQQEEHARNEKAERDAPMADFGAQARAWLNDVVVASLEAAKADVAGEVTSDLANDNGKPEDHLAVVTVALHRAMEGLDAPAKLIVDALADKENLMTIDILCSRHTGSGVLVRKTGIDASISSAP
jgi:hypothetical protein